MNSDLTFDRTLLLKSSWLSSVDPAFAKELLGKARPVKLERDQPVYSLGDPPGGIFAVASGAVVVHVDDGIEGLRAGHIILPGGWFGEAPVLTGQGRQVGMTALRTTILATVALPDLHAIFQATPASWRWLGVLAIQNAAIGVQVARDMMISDPYQRCVLTLDRLMKDFTGPGEQQTNASQVLPVTQSDLAEICALSRSAVAGALSRLESEGRIKRLYGAIEVFLN